MDTVRTFHITRFFLFRCMIVAIFACAFLVRVMNLNYNAPFNDEAIYVVVGRMGVFQGDWQTYNAAGWMAGHPFFYPTMTALSYMTNGIWSSRLFNVLFSLLSLEAIFVITRRLSGLTGIPRQAAGVLALLLLGFATVSLYVARLATYDLPSFTFFLLGVACLLHAQGTRNQGKYYFFAFALLIVGFLTKITVGLYFPFVFIYSYLKARQLGSQNLYYWKRYFVLPFITFALLFGIGNLSNIRSYATSQVGRERNSFALVWQTFWSTTYLVWYAWIPSSVILILKGKIKLWATLSLLSLIILAFHAFSHREPTLDKHVFLTISCLVILIGIAGGEIVKTFQDIKTQIIASGLLFIASIEFAFVSYINLSHFNHLWQNSTPVLSYLSDHVRTGDKLLAEVGAGAILATYDQDSPTNVTTFDWFTYKDLIGDDAYIQAIRDGYFNYIELDGNTQSSGQIHSSLHNYVISSISSTLYQQVFNKKGFLVYERAVN